MAIGPWFEEGDVIHYPVTRIFLCGVASSVDGYGNFLQSMLLRIMVDDSIYWR